MGRGPRRDVAGAIHHVVAQGNGRCRVVGDDVDRVDLVMRLARVADACSWRVDAYCSMDTHLHLVMRTQDANLGKGMGRLLGGYARRFNERHDREGQLWGERYHVTPIDDEAHLVRAGIYVLLNPVRAALCERAEQWCWSSYRGTIGLAEAPEALDGRGLLLALGGDPTDARRALRAIVDGEAARIVAGLRAEPTVPG